MSLTKARVHPHKKVIVKITSGTLPFLQDKSYPDGPSVPEAWSACALQMIFTPWETTGTNGYIADSSFPRGLWRPWEGIGSYTTDGWITVSFPLKDFKFTHEGGSAEMASVGNYGGLTFFVYHGGINGTDCTPEICIDNIRVVPAE